MKKISHDSQTIAQMRDRLCFWLINQGDRAVAVDQSGIERQRWRPLRCVVSEAVRFEGFVRRNTIKPGFQTAHNQVYYSVIYSVSADGQRSMVYMGEGHGGPDARKTALEEALAGALAYPDAVKWMDSVLNRRSDDA